MTKKITDFFALEAIIPTSTQMARSRVFRRQSNAEPSTMPTTV